MSDNLPYAADAEDPLSPSELEVLRKRFREEGQYVTVQTKFNYAWGLIKSANRHDSIEGVKLLTDIYRSVPERRRECLYYIALGHYKLGHWSEARKFNDLLLQKEPSNLQAQSLRALIEDRVQKEGYIGMAVAGAAAALGGIIVASIVRSSKK